MKQSRKYEYQIFNIKELLLIILDLQIVLVLGFLKSLFLETYTEILNRLNNIPDLLQNNQEVGGGSNIDETRLVIS